MAVLNIRDEDVIGLARQLPDRPRQALALALLRDGFPAPSLRTLRQRSHLGLSETLRACGIDIDSSAPDQIDAAIQRICEEP